MKRKYTKRSNSDSSLKKARKVTSKRHPHTLETYRHTTWASINARVGKKAYKNVKNAFDEHSWNKWFNDNSKALQAIIERDMIPSIERIDPSLDYCPENCIWLPFNINMMLGKVNYYKKGLVQAQSYVASHLDLIPDEYRSHYVKVYLN